jgi:hypothetical protein
MRGWYPLILGYLVLALGCPRQGDLAPSELEVPPEPDRAADPGRTLSPEEGGFSLTLPAASSESARSVLGDNHLEFTSEVPGGLYTVEVIYKAGGISNPEQFLARMEASLAEGAQVTSRSEVARGSARGFAMQLRDPRDQHSRVALLVTSHRTYLLVFASADPAGFEDPSVERFFSSFEPKQTTGVRRQVESKEGGFEVEFAQACGGAFKQVEMVDGKVYLSYVSDPQREDQCMVSLARVDPLPSARVFDAAVQGALASVPGAVLDGSTDSALAGKPRRTVRLHATVEGLTLHMRADFVHNNDTLYQLQYLSDDELRVRGPEADAFFGSFRLRGF